MLELTKKPRIDGFVEISAIVQASRVDAVARAIEEALEPNIPANEVLKDSTPGKVLKGMRGIRELTQLQLAELIGVQKSHISEMERGKRPIGKEMAKRLGKALKVSWKIFL